MDKIKKEFKTDFLFSKQDFFSGIGTVFNVSGNYYSFNYSSNPDLKAIESDWRIIGQDIAKSLEKVKQNKSLKLKQVAK